MEKSGPRCNSKNSSSGKNYDRSKIIFLYGMPAILERHTKDNPKYKRRQKGIESATLATILCSQIWSTNTISVENVWNTQFYRLFSCCTSIELVCMCLIQRENNSFACFILLILFEAKMFSVVFCYHHSKECCFS